MEIIKQYRINEAFLTFRRLSINEPKPKSALSSPQSVANIAREVIGADGREIFLIFFLDCANRITSFSRAFTGTVDQAVIYPREVVKYAILADSSRIIVAHNHPSGNTKPSDHDINITNKLKASCSSVDIELLDHVIVADSDYYSFREHGMI